MRIKVIAAGGLLTWLAALMLVVLTGVSSAETEVTPNDVQTVKTTLLSQGLVTSFRRPRTFVSTAGNHGIQQLD
jgi:hypothetical protein